MVPAQSDCANLHVSLYLLGHVALLSNSPVEQPGFSLLSEIKKPGKQVPSFVKFASKNWPSLCKRQGTLKKYDVPLTRNW